MDIRFVGQEHTLTVPSWPGAPSRVTGAALSAS
jgi:hypothetical protein